MAKNKKRRRRTTKSELPSGVAVAGEEPDDDQLGSAAQVADSSGESADSTSIGRGGGAVHGGGLERWLTLYKPGQGYYTRLGTAIGAGLILIFGAYKLHLRLAGGGVPAVEFGVPVVALAITGLILYWVVGVNRNTNDFFIATEGEMKKVSWSTRREVAGSTKVVLAFTVLIALFLFVVDVLFMLMFSALNVLQIDLKTLLGFPS